MELKKYLALLTASACLNGFAATGTVEKKADAVVDEEETIVDMIAEAPDEVAAAFDVQLDAERPTTPGEATAHPGRWRSRFQHCAAVNLAAAQKTQLRDAFIQYKRDAIQLKANVKVAAIDWAKNVLDPAGTGAVASTTGTATLNAINAKAAGKINFANTIFFTILTADQREEGLYCVKELHKAYKHHKLEKACFGISGGGHGHRSRP